mgnify:FL=1
MQLGLIIGILFAIMAALFAMQNIVPVVVSLGFWSFEGSLALVLLMTLGLGALIAGLLSSPAMIRRQWNTSKLARQVADLERKLADEARRNEELTAEVARLREPVASEAAPTEATLEKNYVGLRSLMAGEQEARKSD